ncbi:hypothetical protein CJF42_23045 [Pseudoalteromonas sp. NBT06-2]|uniref:protein adenylyltransferase SelO family protein n=1 Tax=Pseudoalteromonas sp. NBT06-2 TaxID=2025950 RepID=UPI000BA51995|nr:protein adenylyltransferase SelO family protein [Pseudoalteromonas sp. NBT06-2]PAJ72101.1 hypothetical protein CJF42_23045 [Pseudoalteromonas sp. NBT06-2]
MDNTTLIDSLEEALIPFDLTGVAKVKPLWIDYDYLSIQTGKNWTEQKFLNDFSYVVKDSPLFEELTYVKGSTSIGYGEMYGGGKNAGGSRAANINGYQVKGVGRNPLVGKGSDIWHSYGGYSLVDALYELIMSEVLNNVLPHGTIKIVGLILLGEKSSWTPSPGEWKRGRGALLVREKALRPAHFYSLANFKPLKENRRLFSRESKRIKNLYKSYHQKYGVESFEALLNMFIENSAEQFACAKIFRVVHGVINASNSSLDGKWIDLTSASFIDSQINYQEATHMASFYEEHCTVLNFVKGLGKDYNKYNGITVNIEHLIDRYVDNYQRALKTYTFQFLGFYHVNIEEAFDPDSSEIIFDKMLEIIFSSKLAGNERPEKLSLSDPLLLFVESLFKCLLLKSDSETTETTAYKKMFSSYIESLGIEVDKSRDFLKLMMCRTLKKLYFSSHFYHEPLLQYIKSMVENENKSENDNVNKTSSIVSAYSKVATWVFDNSPYEDQECIFKNLDFEVIYDRLLDKFVLLRDHQVLIDNVCESNLKDYDFKINEYDFSEGVRKIITLLG